MTEPTPYIFSGDYCDNMLNNLLPKGINDISVDYDDILEIPDEEILEVEINTDDDEDDEE